MRSRTTLAALALTALAVAVPRAVAGEFGPLPPANPYTAATGTATMHGDTANSDTTPYPGTGTAQVTYRRTALQSACPTVTAGRDGLVVALCTRIFGRNPVVQLIDPADGDRTASYDLPKGSLFGGVYAYLDHDDRLVTVDPDGNLLRIGHHRTADGGWELRADATVALGAAARGGVVGLSPDWRGNVWFATPGGTVGVVTPAGDVHTLALPAGETIANSLSTVPGQTAVTTSHALYALDADADGVPTIQWRRAYDRGTARKPGQLSWGTGATPVYFGPGDGTDYVAITDNADGRENLVVRRRDGSEVCTVPAVDGTEDAVIATGRSVFVTSTYGYPYPALPDDAGTSRPSSASFTGGLTRVDVDADGQGCHQVWSNSTKSAALPRLSVADGRIYTLTVTGPTDSAVGTNTFAAYHYAVLDSATGRTLSTRYLGIGLLYNPLQMTGTTTADGTFWQGTATGVVAVRRSS
ncbi:SMP-30/gluconolactonase/LRE family protein [Streptomyces similanensis]|uniref:VCBS repeat-containing protein n=1 Tax=Streptomyces similanensis TaxID=1274988 RepID=A0ABP9KCT0_9ACTN